MSDAFVKLKKKYRIIMYVFLAVWLLAPVGVCLLSGLQIIDCFPFIWITLAAYLSGLVILVKFIEAKERLAETEEVYGGKIIR